MYKIIYFLVVANLLLLSCKTEEKQTVVLEKKSAFDLEKTNFQENVPLLFSKHIALEEGIEYDSTRDGKLTDERVKYRISNMITDNMHFNVPQNDFGYCYKSPTLDSVAKFQNIYFHSLSILTNKSKKPVAYYAESEFSNVKDKQLFMSEFIKKYGQPKYSFFINTQFNRCSYEWVLKDRSIQVETSFGVNYIIGSDKPMTNEKYYRLDMLIMENKFKDEIHNAHIYELPDKIMYDGKYHDYKDFQFEKKEVFKDNFLLNSTNKNYIRNEFGEFDISRAEKDE